MVTRKSKYSCESAIFFNLDTETVKDNCNFKFYHNETNISLAVLDGENEIILANWPNDKHILCNINNDIPVRIPSHPYVLINRSTLCNCGIKAVNHYPLESTLTDLKTFISSYTQQNESFDLQQKHDANAKINTNKSFFYNNYIMDIFMFISAKMLLLATTLTMYLLCKYKKLRLLMASLILQVKEVGTEMQQTNYECRTLAYIGIISTILSLVLVTFLHYRKSKICKGHRFQNTVKIMIFISDVQNYIPIKLSKTTSSIH